MDAHDGGPRPAVFVCAFRLARERLSACKPLSLRGETARLARHGRACGGALTPLAWAGARSGGGVWGEASCSVIQTGSPDGLPLWRMVMRSPSQLPVVLCGACPHPPLRGTCIRHIPVPHPPGGFAVQLGNPAKLSPGGEGSLAYMVAVQDQPVRSIDAAPLRRSRAYGRHCRRIRRRSCPCNGTGRGSRTAGSPACAPCTRSGHAGSASGAHPA